MTKKLDVVFESGRTFGTYESVNLKVALVGVKSKFWECIACVIAGFTVVEGFEAGEFFLSSADSEMLVSMVVGWESFLTGFTGPFVDGLNEKIPVVCRRNGPIVAKFGKPQSNNFPLVLVLLSNLSQNFSLVCQIVVLLGVFYWMMGVIKVGLVTITVGGGGVRVDGSLVQRLDACKMNRGGRRAG